jgi:endo-1,3(4)-beta-glucanase
MNWRLIIFLLIAITLGAALWWFSIKYQTNHQAQPTNPTAATSLRTIAKTSSWWTSAYQFPSQPLFVNPGAFKITKQGLGITLPQVVASANTVMSPYDEWCSVSPESVSGSQVVGYGDWNVRLELKGQTTSWQVELVQGSPITYLRNVGPALNVNCSNTTAKVVAAGLLIIRPGWPGAILIQADQPLSSPPPSTTALHSASGQYRVALLPDDKETTIQLFAPAVWSPITSTQITWKAQNQRWTTDYAFLNDQGQSETRLLAIPPHIANALSPVAGQVLGTYRTNAGDLSLVSLSKIETSLPIPSLPLQFTSVPSTYQPQMQTALLADAQDLLKADVPAGVYFRGTWLGALASAIQLADLNNQPALRDQLLDRLESVLNDSLSKFHYQANTKMVTADNAEFGNEKGNDHHFHYGYYIRGAAILAHYRPSNLGRLSQTIELLISDIANADRTSSQLPFLRVFSPWEGHSWADAQANFADGNNQESTSEALNAWYAIHLWGQATKNQSLDGLGSWLFSQELQSTQTYWFGQNNAFPAGYRHPMASIVWGGKRDFATWFSAQPLHIYGIQWLPITPASSYLRSLGEWSPQQAELEKATPLLLQHEWADLYVARLAFTDPAAALTKLSSVRTVVGLKLRSLLLQTVYSQLGR